MLSFGLALLFANYLSSFTLIFINKQIDSIKKKAETLLRKRNENFNKKKPSKKKA